MRKMGFVAASVCVLSLIKPFEGREVFLRRAQDSQRLTPQEAISAAHGSSKAGSSFTVLREIVANADTQRIGDQALDQARASQIKLYKNGILADLLSSGGFLIAEYDPKTTNVVALHLVSVGSDGVPKDAYYPCDGVVKLADAPDLAKDTTEFTELLYSATSPEASSLESRFYGGSFPECGQSEECTLFAVPHSLPKVGSDQNQYREAVALYGAIELSGFQYAVSLPYFAANPLVATRAAADRWDGLKAEFLRRNHMDPDFDFDLENIRSKEQLRERIDLLRRLDKFVEEALRNKVDPLVKANIFVATIPLWIGAATRNGQVVYISGGASLIEIAWRRLSTGGFAVDLISVAD